MTITPKQVTGVFLAAIVFYILGWRLYEPFYRLTLDLVRNFSNNRIGFYGKFPFFGDPALGIVSAFIPVSFFLCCQVLQGRFSQAFRWTLLLYLPLLIVFYLAICYYEACSLGAPDHVNNGVLRYSLRKVNIKTVLFSTLVLTSLVIVLVNILKRRSRKPA